MSSNILLALGILALVLQQLAGIFDKAAQWKTLSADDRRALAVKIAVILLGIVGAELLHLNIFPVGTFDASVSPFVLMGLSGILAGFGYDVAVGAIKLGGNLNQIVGAQAIKVNAEVQAVVDKLAIQRHAALVNSAPPVLNIPGLDTPIPHSATASAVIDANVGIHG